MFRSNLERNTHSKKKFESRHMNLLKSNTFTIRTDDDDDTKNMQFGKHYALPRKLLLISESTNDIHFWVDAEKKKLYNYRVLTVWARAKSTEIEEGRLPVKDKNKKKLISINKYGVLLPSLFLAQHFFSDDWTFCGQERFFSYASYHFFMFGGC